jgi:hypothetical protein
MHLRILAPPQARIALAHKLGVPAAAADRMASGSLVVAVETTPVLRKTGSARPVGSLLTADLVQLLTLNLQVSPAGGET